MNREKLQQKIEEILSAYPGVLWGCCAVEEEAFKDTYSHVIVSILPFQEMLTLENYHEPYFREIQYATFPIRNELEARMSQMLEEQQIPHHVVTLPDLSKTLTAEFSDRKSVV